MTETVNDPVVEDQEQSGLAKIGQEMVDGALGALAIKDGVVLDTIGKRAGSLMAGAGLGIAAYSRLAVKPALNQLSSDARARVIEDIPLGGITIGHSA